MSITNFLYDGAPGFGRTQDVAEPDLLRAGDSLAWTAKWSQYPSGAGWVLAYVLNSPTQKIAVLPGDISPNADGVSFNIAIPSSETKSWPPGVYQWIASITLGTVRQTAGLGQLILQADLMDATTPVDTRSPAEINLAAADAAIAARAAGGIESYMISGRETKYMSMADLFRMRSYYAAQVRQERLDRGELPPASRVVATFGSDWGPSWGPGWR